MSFDSSIDYKEKYLKYKKKYLDLKIRGGSRINMTKSFTVQSIEQLQQKIATLKQIAKYKMMDTLNIYYLDGFIFKKKIFITTILLENIDIKTTTIISTNTQIPKISEIEGKLLKTVIKSLSFTLSLSSSSSGPGK